MTQRYLVTGGAGFIGSHLVAELLAGGHEVVVFDNLSTGHSQAVSPDARLIKGDLADAEAIDAVLRVGAWDAVFHLGDLSLVGESMRDPLRYLSVNPGNGGRLIAACVRHGVGRFVFSSSAALFGNAGDRRIDESTPIAPGSAYGESKHMVERILKWADQVHGLRSACLRYFNAAGSDPAGRLGEDHKPETHLIPLVIDAALGRRAELAVFGCDYPTPDGTCVRDYVHVADLARAHIGVLAHLQDESLHYNVGIGRGYSVREVIASVERVSGLSVPVLLADRRPGDPATLVADPSKLMREVGWAPRFDRLDAMIATAFAWRQNHPNGYGS